MPVVLNNLACLTRIFEFLTKNPREKLMKLNRKCANALYPSSKILLSYDFNLLLQWRLDCSNLSEVYLYCTDTSDFTWLPASVKIVTMSYIENRNVYTPDLLQIRLPDTVHTLSIVNTYGIGYTVPNTIKHLVLGYTFDGTIVHFPQELEILQLLGWATYSYHIHIGLDDMNSEIMIPVIPNTVMYLNLSIKCYRCMIIDYNLDHLIKIILIDYQYEINVNEQKDLFIKKILDFWKYESYHFLGDELPLFISNLSRKVDHTSTFYPFNNIGSFGMLEYKDKMASMPDLSVQDDSYDEFASNTYIDIDALW
jgi:hypothetical protein